MPLFTIVNPNLKPWNIFNKHESPDLTISGNVIINGREWFNSYLSPPSFEMNVSKTKWMFDNLKLFFQIEEKILMSNQPVKDFKYYLALLYLSINLTQAYLDPIEAIATRKKWPKKYNSYNKMVKISEKQVDSLTNYFSLETIIFPLTVLINQKQNKHFRLAFNKTAKLLMCSNKDLATALTRINNTFQPKKFMDTDAAFKLITNNVRRIGLNICPKDKFNYDLQTLSSIITWSKYINIRFRLTNDTLTHLLDFKEITNDKYLAKVINPKTSSGSEKYGIAIYCLVYLFNKSNNLKSSVIKKAKQIAKIVDTGIV